MLTILNLAWLDLLRLFRDRTQLGVMILLPLMLTALFGMMAGGGERRVVVAVSDPDRTVYTADVLAGLPESSYDLRRVPEEEARAMAGSGEAAAAVLIPKGFSDDVLAGVDTRIVIVKDPRSTSALAVVEGVRGGVNRTAANATTVRTVRAAYRDASARTGAALQPPPPGDIYTYADSLWEPDPPLSVAQIEVTASKVRGSSTIAEGFSQYSMGFTVMFMLFMGFGVAGGFLEDREQGTLSRLLVTPASRALLVLGKVVGVYVTVIFEAAIMIGLGALAFRVPWGDDPLGVAMIVAAFALAATGLGIMASTLVRSRGQLSAIMAAGATALSMLGGCYWPLDVVNPTMRTIATFTPTGWAMQGLTDVVVRAQGAGQAAIPSLVLIGMATVFLVIGVSRLKLE